MYGGGGCGIRDAEILPVDIFHVHYIGEKTNKLCITGTESIKHCGFRCRAVYQLSSNHVKPPSVANNTVNIWENVHS